MCRKPVISRTAQAEQRSRTYPRVVPQQRQRVLVSIGTTICLVFAALAPALLERGREPPAYALSSSVVFYLERLLATFLISYVVLVIVARSAIRGELPATISKNGLRWPDDVSAATKEAVESLQRQFEMLEHDLDELAEHVVLGRRLP